MILPYTQKPLMTIVHMTEGLDNEDKLPLPTHEELCEMMIEHWEKEIRLVQAGLGFRIGYHKQIVNQYKQILKKLK